VIGRRFGGMICDAATPEAKLYALADEVAS
jgi:hypothetical protein